MAKQAEEEKIWPNYAEHEAMQSESEPDYSKMAAYIMEVQKGEMEWHKQWRRDDSDDSDEKAQNAQKSEFVLEQDMFRKISEKKFASAYETDQAKKITMLQEVLKMTESFKPKSMINKDTLEGFVAGLKMEIDMAQMQVDMQKLLAAGNMAKYVEVAQQMGSVQTKYNYTPKPEDVVPLKRAWQIFYDCVMNDPMHLSMDISVSAYQEAIQSGAQPYMGVLDKYKQLQTELSELLLSTLEAKQVKFHKYAMYVSMDALFANKENDVVKGKPHAMRKKVCETIYNDLSQFLSKMAKGGHLSKQEKAYAKFLLVWKWKSPAWDGGRDYYKLLMTQATNVMNTLRVPLDEEYKKLEKKDSPIIKMKLPDGVKCDASIKSQRDLLAFTWSDWFEGYDLPVSEEAIAKIKENYKKWGFSYFGSVTDKSDNFDFDKEIDPFFNSLESVTQTYKRRYVASNSVALDIINQVAYKVNDIFQPKMQQLFEMNRKKMGLALDDDDIKNKSVGVFSGPIKTKARQIIKCDTDYVNSPVPRSGSVLDDVRCAVVVADDVELVSLFQLICNDEKTGYKGRIYRAKNAFSDVKKNSFGYRAVLMNVIETYTTKVDGKDVSFPLIVEIQLILKSYFEIRKSMHLGYSIVRSETPTQLSTDACKVGVLDI